MANGFTMAVFDEFSKIDFSGGNMYVVLVNLTVQHEHIGAFEKAAIKNAKTSVSEEKGCHRFDVAKSETSPIEWMFYELYTDRAAFDYHHAQPHFLEYDETVRPYVTSKTLMTYLTVE